MWRCIGQVIAPLLVIQRIADGSADAGRAITAGHTAALHGRNPGESGVVDEAASEGLLNPTPSTVPVPRPSPAPPIPF